MHKITLAVVVATLVSPVARSADGVSFSPAALVFSPNDRRPRGAFIEVFPPAGKEFEIPLPLIPRWFTYGPRGRLVFATLRDQNWIALCARIATVSC